MPNAAVERRLHKIETSLLTVLQDAVLEQPFALIVLGWLLIYGAIGGGFFLLYFFLPGGVHMDDVDKVPWDQVLSFSFITQATIGYGDVTPVGLSQLLANLQAVIGTGLNGAAVGVITLRILKRKPPLRIPRRISFSQVGDNQFAFKFRYLNIDSRNLVDTYVSVFFSADGTRSNRFYDSVGGDVGSMQMETVPPLLLVALVIPSRETPVSIRDPSSPAMLNDAKIALNPEMFAKADGEVDPSAKLLLRIRGFHAATGELFSLSHEYRAADIVCAPFEGIDNNPLQYLKKGRRRRAISETVGRVEAGPSQRCGACQRLARCPFTAGPRPALQDGSSASDGWSAVDGPVDLPRDPGQAAQTFHDPV